MVELVCMTPTNVLRALKLLHTSVWAVVAGCVLAMPVLAWLGRPGLAAVAGGVVLAESLIILFNRGQCPITPVAARYTDDRRANFDIYLPEWLARYNKEIFGGLYAAGLLFILLRAAGPMYLKSLVVFFFIALIETIHGILRARLLAPKVGDLRSRQLGVITGSALILLAALVSVAWINPPTRLDALYAGVLWVVLMGGYEVALGHFVFKLSWERILGDFNVAKGGFLGFGMLVLALAPLITGRMLGLW